MFDFTILAFMFAPINSRGATGIRILLLLKLLRNAGKDTAPEAADAATDTTTRPSREGAGAHGFVKASRRVYGKG